MTATEHLRRLLDERGIIWWSGNDERTTIWGANELTWEYFNNENGDAWLGFLEAREQDISPEQAITATLGNSDRDQLKAENKQLRKEMEAMEGYDQMLRDERRQERELYVKAKKENAKLRELVNDMWFWCYQGYMSSENQEWQMQHIDGVLNRIRELGRVE